MADKSANKPKKVSHDCDTSKLQKPAKQTAASTTNSVKTQTRRTIFLLLLAVAVGICRWRYQSQFSNDGDSAMIQETLKSMLNIESRVTINKNLNVAVGFGSCLDIYVSSKDLIFEQYDPPKEQAYHENITTQEQLNEVLAYFFAEGAAAERFIDNRTLFQDLVDRAQLVEHSRKSIGGNAAVMAKRFILEGLEKVILGTQHSKLTTNEFHDKLLVSGPIVDQDDVHICLEYPAGEKWGKYVAPRANRLIVHSDHFNPSLQSVDNFLDRVENAKQLDLLVIGGLQMMDNIPIPIELRRQKLQKLSKMLYRLAPDRPKIHFELASFAEEALLESIKDFVIPHIHSLGMNEQELPNLLGYLKEGDVNIRSEAYPRVASILDQMRHLYQLLQKPTRGRLSRIHVHTLAFQAIMVRKGSQWLNTLTSSVKAALTAHRYTCGSHEIDMDKAKIIMDESFTTSKQGSRRRIPFNPKHPVVCWQEDIQIDSPDNKSSNLETIEICVAPVLVCTKVKQTAGAGDNVSAAGLIFQF